MKKRPRKPASTHAVSAPANRKARKPRAISRPQAVEAVAVTKRELEQLRRELERRMRTPRRNGRIVRGAPARPQPKRWNPDPEDVQRSVAQLVLTLVEFLRQLMERQAIRRMERKTLSEEQIEAVGLALMRLEETVHDIGRRFGLTPEDLNLDLGPIKLR